MNKNSDPMQGFLEQLLRDWESGGGKPAAAPAPAPPQVKQTALATVQPAVETPAVSSVIRSLPELSEATSVNPPEPPKPALSWRPAPTAAKPAAEPPKPTFHWRPAPPVVAAPPPPPPAPVPEIVVAAVEPPPIETAPAPPKPTLHWKAAVEAPAAPAKPVLLWKPAPAPPVPEPPPAVAVAPPPPPPPVVVIAPPPPAAPPAALIDFAAALSALKASRPAKTSAAPTPDPETFEPAELVTFSSIAGQTALEVVEPVVPEDVVEVVEEVEEVLPEEPEVVDAAAYDVAVELPEVEAEPEPEPEAPVEPEPEALVEPEPEPVVEPEREVELEPEPVAESEPIPVLLAEPEPQSEPEPEWEEIAAPLPPVRPHGHELAAVVSNFETELPAGPWDQAAAESRRVELRRHLVFAINEERFAVNLDNLVEIDNMPTWTGIPGLPQTVRGLINLRGEIVSLLELRAILGLPHPEIPKKGKIFVASTADRQTVSAFAVDEIDGIFGFDEARLTPIPTPTPGITSTVEEGGRLIRILDISGVLTDVEKTFSLDQVWI